MVSLVVVDFKKYLVKMSWDFYYTTDEKVKIFFSTYLSQVYLKITLICVNKGQLISKADFLVLIWTKKRTQIGQIKKVKALYYYIN